MSKARKQRPLYLVTEKATSESTEVQYVTGQHVKEWETEAGAYIRVRPLNRIAIRTDFRKLMRSCESKKQGSKELLNVKKQSQLFKAAKKAKAKRTKKARRLQGTKGSRAA